MLFTYKSLKISLKKNQAILYWIGLKWLKNKIKEKSIYIISAAAVNINYFESANQPKGKHFKHLVIDLYGNFHFTNTDTNIPTITDADTNTNTDKKKTWSPIPIPISKKEIHRYRYEKLLDSDTDTIIF